MKNLHGIIFSYERPNALGELVAHRTAASVPFGGRYRVVDFMLSNMVNARITKVGFVTPYYYRSIMDHMRAGKV